MDTGRRPDEIARLMLDCLETDPDGKPVLIYDNFKAHRNGRRLPIAAATAAIIADQQQRVRARFPGTPDSQLRLIPSSATRNPACCWNPSARTGFPNAIGSGSTASPKSPCRLPSTNGR